MTIRSHRSPPHLGSEGCASTDSRQRGVWRKSSRSGSGTNECVEVFLDDDLVLVRDSKDPDGPVLEFGGGDWRQFVGAVKGGGFCRSAANP